MGGLLKIGISSGLALLLVLMPNASALAASGVGGDDPGDPTVYELGGDSEPEEEGDPDDLWEVEIPEMPDCWAQEAATIITLRTLLIWIVGR